MEIHSEYVTGLGRNGMKIGIMMEHSGVVRDAFLDHGFDAYSVDILPCESTRYTDPARHIQADVWDVIDDPSWDMVLVCHPPCTRLCNSGVRWLSSPPKGKTLPQMWDELDEGARLFAKCLDIPAPFVAVENPVMHKHAKEAIDRHAQTGYREFSQSVQPYEFGDPVTKRTCLWLKGLPNLEPTNVLPKHERKPIIHHAAPGPDRWKVRSQFFPGMADAMASQWGNYAEERIA